MLANSHALRELRAISPPGATPARPPRSPYVTLDLMTRAQLDKRPADVAAMFDAVAERYDLLNDVLSLGQDRRLAVGGGQAVAARPGDRVLDIAAGTGTSSRAFTAAGARCVACDFSLGMLRGSAAASRAAAGVWSASWPATRCGCRSPTRPSTWSRSPSGCATSPTRRGAGRDAPGHQARRQAGDLRVQPPACRPLDRAYQRYLAAGAARRGAAAVVNPEAYDYLAESIRGWPPSRSWPSGSGGAAGRPCGGATSPSGSSPCTSQGARGGESGR